MITIRNAAMEDAGTLLEIYGHYVRSTAISFEYEVPSEVEFRRRMENTMQRYPYLVAEQDGQIQGYAYAGAFNARAAYDWCCETTIYLRRDARKHGMGRLVYGASNDDLETMLGNKGCSCSAMVFENSFWQPQVTAGVLREESLAIL